MMYIYILLFISLSAFTMGTVIFYRFSKATKRSLQAPFTSLHFFDAIFFGLGNKRDMNIAASCFIIFLLGVWGMIYVKKQPHFWGSPDSYFGLGIAGIVFLILHCRYRAKSENIKNDGLAPMKELINFRRSGLTSPFLWLSRIGYLGSFIGMMR
ncbi:hypothetical protein [Lelliottia amnigena]|uniref:hypothetical protein n=1 Tax=Lelliottia amnigena TaxID=61646 RepID=UPI001EF7A730|nr:hypothetical protein [Lelliottia amnigena]MBM7355447.1 FtsH-binding integral membrane protein [Lelliottia amnigena]MCG7781905.1 hypothetical protein [Lelliottia amnigena]WSO17793.1 hypothetical protein VUJ45_11775 [Lelliottia amnigena]